VFHCVFISTTATQKEERERKENEERESKEDEALCGDRPVKNNCRDYGMYSNKSLQTVTV